MPGLRWSVRLIWCAAMSVGFVGCVRAKPKPAPVPEAPRSKELVASEPSAACAACAEQAASNEVIRALAQRVSDLKARGGDCQAYASVLEGSLAARRIVVRPYMWRVGTQLASAQATSTGEIDVARDVDALNVGRRSLDEVVHSVEHEAAHIAFAIPSGTGWNELLVDERVGGCRRTGL
ncbi:MAG: hypothetical protein HYV19_08180 [Gemmatimonadetes bacterium]|nr:hypothetical protein [Gemmatimonadota bacterium]